MNPSDTGTSGGVAQPAAVGAQPAQAVTPRSPAPAPTSKPTPVATPAQTIVEVSPVTPPPATSQPINYTPVIAVVVVLGILSAVLLRARRGEAPKSTPVPLAKNENKKKEDTKCLNYKKLMDEKLEELKDLKGQLKEKAKEKAKDGIKKALKGTQAGKLAVQIEGVEEQYNKLKDLYEKCIAGIEMPIKRNIFIFHGTEGYPHTSLISELKKRDHKIIIPQFPVPMHIRKWWEIFGRYGDEFNEEVVLISHGEAGAFLFQVLENLEYSIAGAIFLDYQITPEAMSQIKNKAKHIIVIEPDTKFEKLLDKIDSIL
jgi:hypothetical protein